MRMKEKVVLITGATGEIGSAMTQGFLAEGASVCITGRSAEKLADMSESLGAGAKLTRVTNSCRQWKTRQLAAEIELPQQKRLRI